MEASTQVGLAIWIALILIVAVAAGLGWLVYSWFV
jgi:hypothetical protein